MNRYKKKELVNQPNVVTSNGSNNCMLCNLRIKKREASVAFKFFSKKTIYTHFNCKESFFKSLE